ncbi:hypothetical protein B5E77_00275 [Lachnoclostridium sp. An131]|uniref:hypothetical protein n=1 Tax=Lachnoclostridium sp. An131 TaxID=1965555 RepID=UPI000B372D1B|nr:hypothetical protein [Lachnoclostridium sp. An131]OUQ28841.1 hypothetical protein B5E77_00275 [Lachnoclostridium sp. An131]
MRKNNTQLRFWLLTILTMLLLFSLTGCAACGQKNTETTDTETTETITEPETSIETDITDEVEATDEGLSSSDTNTSDEPETAEPELTVEGNGTGVDGVSDEEVQAEIDEAPVTEGQRREDLDEETLEMTNNLTFNGVQYDTWEEYWQAVNEYEAANDPDVYTPDEFDEILNW